MKNIWLHRISHHADVTYPLLQRNYLSIGFSDFSTSNFVDDVLTTGWEALEQMCDEQWGSRPRTRHNLWRFIHEMKTGDWVVVPSWGEFSVYELTGNKALPIGQIQVTDLKDWHGNVMKVGSDDLLHRAATDEVPQSEAVDLGFVWPITPVCLGISREQYADSVLTARMKIRSTNAWIGDLRQSVENAIEARNQNRPINIHAQITEASVPSVLAAMHQSLNPDKLERLIRWYFQRVGASDVWIPAKNAAEKEGDADVIATFQPIKTIIYVQAKFHRGETSSWAAEQIKAYKESKEVTDSDYSRLCWVVSTADGFAEDCKQAAQESGIQLIDGKRFAAMLLEAGLAGLDSALNK